MKYEQYFLSLIWKQAISLTPVHLKSLKIELNAYFLLGWKKNQVNSLDLARSDY